MKLTLKQIREITKGAVRVEEENGQVRFYRFTKEQEELYKVTSEDFYVKTFATAGVKLCFKTDTKSLFLKVNTKKASSRRYFSFDIYADRKYVDCLDNFSDVELPVNYTTVELPLGSFSKTVQFEDGIKTVCIYFPWSVAAAVEEISVDDGCLIEPISIPKRILVYGDSITHGYDVLHPYNRYASRLAEALGAEEVNKAIGGEIFFPELAKLKDDFVPDYITVAYGTNDWNKIDEETFKNNCSEFYTTLSKNYPDSQIFAITPIWRKDLNENRVFGEFRKVEEDIKDIVKSLDNVTLISGFSFVPENEDFYADLRLHPNDVGFEHYFNNLYNKIMR